MKQILSWLLLFALLMSLCACTASPEETVITQPSQTETEATTSTESDPPVYEKADDPLTPEKLSNLGIANDSMTSQELRQICVDYLKLSVSCQWIADDTYFLVEEDNPERHFTEGKLYGGLPYVYEASGNLYRFMEYYDSETGVFDSTELQKSPSLFATACSGTAGWAWARVINSMDITWTHSLTAANGLIPIGPYKYDHSIKQWWVRDENGKKVYNHDTKKICKENGEQTMFESYALTLLADCYSRTGHVAMAVSEPVVVRNTDGTINGEESYVMLAEQGQYTKAKFHIRHTSDGTEYRIRGNDGRPFTFQEMYEAGYLVHTFKEFLGEDPVEPGIVTIPHAGKTASADQLSEGDLVSNYPISDIFTKVYDKDGNEVYSYVTRATYHFARSFACATALPIEALRGYENEGYTVKITCQISNGELVDVYSAPLVS